MYLLWQYIGCRNLHGQTYSTWMCITMQQKTSLTQMKAFWILVSEFLPPDYWRRCKESLSWFYWHALQEPDSWDPTFFPHQPVALHHDLLQNVFLERLQDVASADCDSFLVHVTWSSTTVSSCSLRNLKQRVSETLHSTRWTNSMACSFTWL
jgi:hypothetical protein